jgi:hypothetical protein
MTRRRVAVGLALVALVATSGCIGFLTGSESLTFDSDPVAVSGDAQDESGYDEVRRGTENVTREFEVAGQTREVEVRNHQAEYSRTVSVPTVGEQEFARFTVLSTPKVEIAGETFNPVGDWDNRELALRLQQEYDTIENVREEDERTVTVLGNETTVTRFRADAQTEAGQSVEVFIDVTQVGDGDDFVVAVAVYPTELDGETDRVDTLLEGVQHGEEAA